MPVTICHGQPKSGSTFIAYSVICLSNHTNQHDYWELAEKLGLQAGFYEDLTADVLMEVGEKAQDYFFPIKTHRPLTDDVKQLVEAGDVAAVTSFRDPRDICLSYLDAGKMERARGTERYFSSFHNVEDTFGPIRFHEKNLQPWLNCQTVLAIPHYMSANAHDDTIKALCRYFGHEDLWEPVAQEMAASKESLPEFNKAVSDRFADDLPAEEIEVFQDVMQEHIAVYQANLDRVMDAWGFADLKSRLCNERDRKLAARGVTSI